jgi:ribonuclease E
VATSTEDRPAEPTAVLETSEPATEPEPTVEPEVEPTAESAELPAMAAAEPTPSVDADGAKPQVVTRTRRRSASRPAGPPTGVAGASPDTGLVEPGTADLEPGAEADAVPAFEHHVEHVPIKKKGTRKR